MAIYFFYLTKDFKVEASVTERSENHLISALELETKDMIDVITIMQQAVDSTLIQLDANRYELENQREVKDFN